VDSTPEWTHKALDTLAAANRTNAARVRATMRRADALTMRASGLPYSSIARKLGITRQRAQQLVSGAMDSLRAQTTESVDELRALEISRLDGLLGVLWPKAAKGDLSAIDRVLKIGERRMKLLGIEAPAPVALRVERSSMDSGVEIYSAAATIEPSKLSTQAMRELLDARVMGQAGGLDS
jgi:hypothetical protein